MAEPADPGAPRRAAGSRAAGGPPTRLRPPATLRLAVLAALVGLLVAGGLADRTGGPALPPSASTVAPVPVAAPPGAVSSSWFCAGATGTTGGVAGGRLVVANAARRPVTATVTLAGTTGPSATRTVVVGSRATASLPEALDSHPGWVGATVTLDGGEAAVSQVVDGPLGSATSPCATSGSAQWYFTSGATLVNATTVVTLLNPYPTDAVVDLSFVTDQGVEAPGDYQAVDVGPGAVVALDLGAHLRRRTAIATTVRARVGRVVAWQTAAVSAPAAGSAIIGAPSDPTNPTSADPALAGPGMVLTLGAPSVGSSWSWPDGQVGDGLDERFVIYNPGSVAATVTLSVVLDQGRAEPFVVTVAPQAVTTVSSQAQARIPSGVGHSVSVRSANGVGVVASRAVVATAPSPVAGRAVLPGLRTTANRWLVPVATAGGSASSLVLLDTTASPLDVTVYGWRNGAQVPLTGLSHVTVAPGQRSELQLTGVTSDSAVVEATGPIQVQSNLAASVPGSQGLSLSAAVPLS